MKNRLVIFDIDGTLTDTLNLDDRLYREALFESFGIELLESEWQHAKEMTSGTDSGIFELIHKDHLLQGNLKDNIAFQKHSFMRKLRHVFTLKPNIFREVPGAASLINLLKSRNDITTGIATGSWKESGLLKLHAAKINIDRLVYGNSDISGSRQEIIKYVITTYEKMKKTRFDEIIYFGDGVWDYLASKELGIRFIGVNNEVNNILYSYGADKVIRNFKNADEIMELITS